MHNKKLIKILVLTISMTLLTACTSVPTTPRGIATSTDSPTATSTPAPTITILPQPTATPSPEPETIKTTVVVIGADELRLENLSGNILDSFPYKAEDSPVAVIAGLNKLYGKKAVITYSGEETCWYHMNTYQWDNMKIDFQSETHDPASSDSFYASTNQVNENYERVVQAPNGAQISFSYSKLVAANPELPHRESEYAGVTYGTMIGELTANPIDDSPYNIAGVLVHARNDTVTALSAPSFLEGDC